MTGGSKKMDGRWYTDVIKPVKPGSNLDDDKCRYISHVYLINTNDCSSYKKKGEK